MRTDPIIITGAGHSGTRGLVQVLTQAEDVFLGDINNPYNEWHFYLTLAQEVNCRLLFIQPHDHNIIPTEFYWNFYPTSDQCKKLRNFFIQEIQSNLTKSMPPDSASIWVIKNPRTNICLNIWHSVFPNAQFINFIRDGRDVAANLPVWAGSLSRRFELWRAHVNRMWVYELHRGKLARTNLKLSRLPKRISKQLKKMAR